MDYAYGLGATRVKCLRLCRVLLYTNSDATRAVYKAAKNLSHEKQFFYGNKTFI